MAPDESMLDTFDSLCIGEGEEATFDLIEQLEQGISPTGIPNLWIKKVNSIEKNPTRPFIDDLDSVPYPDRQMWEEWIDFERSSKRPSILLGRGCPYNCTYCCNHAIRKLAKGPYVRFRSPDNIIGEIEEILGRFPNTKEFYCEVETFSAHWKWSLELCSRLEEFNSKRTQPLSFGVNVRITKDFMKRNIDEYFGRLKRANFRFINVGLESGSERIRREILKRDYSNEDLIHAIEKAKKHNLEIIFFNMVGFPYETLDDFHETVRLNQICLPNWHYLSIFYPYPGTDLHNLCEEMGVLPKDLLDLELERISAPLDFPDFRKKQIQKAFIWFDYYVYKDHKPMDFLTNNLLYKYRLVYGQNIDDKLPRLIARDLLDPSLRFDVRYQVDIIFWELVKKFPELEQLVLSKPRSQQALKHKQVNPKKIKLKACSLNLGELHQLADFGFFNSVFHCETEDGDEFIANMRLHITEPLEQLIIVDPRAFNDDGYAANSTGSQILKRRSSYNDVNTTENFVSNPALLNGAALYEIQASEIKKALLNGYDFQSECYKSRQVGNRETRIAFTCHDPQIIGGGNTILFRYVNWLAELGIKSTIYSCGHHPSWKRVRAKFRNFSTYSEMFSAIEEDIVVIFSMWHIEPILKTNPAGKRIYHLRQTYESLNYGKNFQSMLTRKPVIELLESLPLGAITTSPHLHEWYKHKLGIESFQITNGINLEVFYSHKRKNTKSLTKRIVSVGNPMHYLKGVDVLANSLMLISKKRPELNFKWTIASGEKGKLNSSQVLAENLEFSYRTGLNQTQMRELYQNADLFVNPSLYEGFGLPALEAMACGTPVIQTDNHGLDSIVEDNHNALVVPLNNPVKMAESIERIIDDEKLTERLRTQGLETARRYSLANQFDMCINVFEEITQISLPAAKAGMIRSKLATNYTDVTFPKDLQAVQRTSVENKSLVSVVIPTYNQAQYLREALESLLAQTYSHWEAIVVNDGSTDNTNEVMNEYSKRDSRIKPISKINGGITSALNEGLKYCQGDYFCWLSSDDLYYPNKLETLIKAFENLDEDYALTYGSFDLLKEESHTIKVQPFQKSKMKGVEFPEALKFDFIDGCSMMIRMDVMREVDGFNLYYLHSQDSELWMRIASRGYRFHLVDKKVTIRRVHAAQASTSNVIYCRYDAAWMINYYLEHFHLLEMYRYFDLTKNDDNERFVEHFVGRMLHTEAVVNHPLIQQKFWRWFDQGLTALVPYIQIIILKKCLNQLQSNKTATYKIDYYLKECLNALSKKREYVPFTLNFSVEGRDIRYDNREKDELAKDLFDYSTNLLVNSHTPLFAQELHLHNCHQIVDTPFKLAHSAIRYLSQYANQYQEIASSHADLSHIPANQDEATKLFCSLRFPDLTEAFDQSLAFDPGRSS
ncbi:MAG: glycosyltransferase, partial [Candidatus Bathyarchaeota archaeon]